jgi:hypothetical protein
LRNSRASEDSAPFFLGFFVGLLRITGKRNSAYPPVGIHTVLQITGSTDTGGGQGGGMLSQIDLSTLQGTTLTTTDGGAYVFPSGYVPALVMFANTALIGELVPLPGTTAPSIGLIGNLSKNFLFPINLPNTNVTAF